MIVAIPEGAQFYKRTPTFTEESVPEALLHDHSTKDGCWGRLRVEEGCLRYVITDTSRDPDELILTPDTPPVAIEPTILHRVEPVGAVRFHVEFFRIPSA